MEVPASPKTQKKAQRNAKASPEMAAAGPAASASKKGKKAKATVLGGSNIGVVPEGAVALEAGAAGAAAAAAAADLLPPDMEAEQGQSNLRFCPVCENYLYTDVDAESLDLFRVCRKCGHKEKDTKGGLVMEMMIQQQSAEGYKILLNEFTRKDPRLPHIRKNITCPNVGCDSNKGGKDPDVIYIKYDAVNLLYLYICDICGEKWHSRERN
jgi:DNA-directed RNA polymerase subunit M/transcription elongation factor TFIIS